MSDSGLQLLSDVSSRIVHRRLCLRLALELDVSQQALALVEARTDRDYDTSTCQQIFKMWWFDQPEGQRTARPLHHALVRAGEAVIAEDHETELLSGKLSTSLYNCNSYQFVSILLMNVVAKVFWGRND